MKRNAFGQIVRSPLIRMVGDDVEGGGKEFTPPASQEELDKLINGAVARTHKQYEPIKEKATKWDTHEAESKSTPQPNDAPGEKPTGLSQEEVDKRINDARAADRLELALERVNDSLDKALDGRSYAASQLFNLDRTQFVMEDGKTVNMDELRAWVEKNSTEGDSGAGNSRRVLRGQGERDSNATGGSVQTGRDLYDEIHKKKSGKD